MVFSAAGDRAAPSGKVLNLLNNDLRRIDDVFLSASMSVQFPIFLGGTMYQIAVRFGFYPFLAVAVGIVLGRFPRNLARKRWQMVRGYLIRVAHIGISSSLFGITERNHCRIDRQTMQGTSLTFILSRQSRATNGMTGTI